MGDEERYGALIEQALASVAHIKNPAEAGVRLGVSEGTIRRWREGKRGATVRGGVRDVLDALEAGAPPTPPPDAPPAASGSMAAELAAIRRLTQDPLMAWALYEAAAAGMFAEAERARAAAVAEWARSARSRSETVRRDSGGGEPGGPAPDPRVPEEGPAPDQAARAPRRARGSSKSG
jgi:hypothetical protein